METPEISRGGDLTLSRSLLAPGPQPPLSHLGVTLLRHVVATGLRYTFYQLGLPMPESPPVRIVRLRLYLDAEAVRGDLSPAPGGAAIAEAVLDPAGAGRIPHRQMRLRVAARLHRHRLHWLGPRSHRFRRSSPPGGRLGAWLGTRALLDRRLPYLCDLMLWEVLESLARRRRRRAGVELPACLGEQARRWRLEGAARLESLGLLDPLRPSWKEGLPVGAAEVAGVSPETVPPRWGGRGSFREGYRAVLSELRPGLFELGRQAVVARILEAPEDVFFLPFDLTGELAGGEPRAWIRQAVEANRRELEALLQATEPPDRLTVPPERSPMIAASGEWALSPLQALD